MTIIVIATRIRPNLSNCSHRTHQYHKEQETGSHTPHARAKAAMSNLRQAARRTKRGNYVCMYVVSKTEDYILRTNAVPGRRGLYRSIDDVSGDAYRRRVRPCRRRRRRRVVSIKGAWHSCLFLSRVRWPSCVGDLGYLRLESRKAKRGCVSRKLE